MDWRLSFGGFAVGLLIGMTGMGGGTLMTPMLIFLFHMKPTLAVGTDLLYGAITKVFGSFQHIRQKTVHFPAFRWLTMGSVPGAFGGSWLVGWMTHHVPMHQVNHAVRVWLGGVYLLIIAAIVFRWYLGSRRAKLGPARVLPTLPKIRLLVLGLVGGFLVGLTSVGSGSIFIAVLSIIYPLSGATMVGTDVTQAALLTSVAGITHWAFGNVDVPVVLSLIVGSVPGILIGSRLTTRVPDSAVRVGLMAMLCYTSYALLSR